MEIDVEAIIPKYTVIYNGKKVEVSKNKKERYEFVLDAVIKKNGGAKCNKCGDEKNLTIEHIVPWSLCLQFGRNPKRKYDDLDNLEILCRKCNVLKADKLDFTHPKTKEILFRYLKEV